VKFVHASLVLIALLVTACSTMNINVPALDGSENGERLPGKVIWHELLTDTPAQTQQFYTALFGWEFEPLADERLNYLLIRNQGKLIGGMIDQTKLSTDADISQWVMLLAVADIAAATREVSSAGGTVFTPPTSLGDRGEIAVVADSQGALFALLQTRDGDPADSDETPAAGDFLWHELWTGDAEVAAGFYGKLAPYKIEQKTLGTTEASVDYRLLASGDKTRAGIRTNPFEGLPPIWVNYLRVSDAQALDSILAKVEALGGEILVPATLRPGGGKVAVISGPSGAGIALQTWSEEQTVVELVEEEQ
jgi:uncharacterized protein